MGPSGKKKMKKNNKEIGCKGRRGPASQSPSDFDLGFLGLEVEISCNDQLVVEGKLILTRWRKTKPMQSRSFLTRLPKDAFNSLTSMQKLFYR